MPRLTEQELKSLIPLSRFNAIRCCASSITISMALAVAASCSIEPFSPSSENIQAKRLHNGH